MLPHPCCLPRLVVGSASTTLLFEACSGLTRVTARWIARQPKAAFVTGLRRSQLPSHIARQLPDQSTITWVEPPSTDTPRLRGALPIRTDTDRASGEGLATHSTVGARSKPLIRPTWGTVSRTGRRIVVRFMFVRVGMTPQATRRLAERPQYAERPLQNPEVCQRVGALVT